MRVACASMRRVIVAAAVLLLTLLLLFFLPSAASAQSYTFAKIADNSGLFSAFSVVPGSGSPAGINDAGLVAFHAVRDDGGAGIYAGDGGPVTTVLDDTGEYSGFGFPSINNSGTVAFGTNLDRGEKRIVSIAASGGGPITVIASSTGPLNDFGVVTTVNAGGTAAFEVELDPCCGNGGVAKGGGGMPLTTITTHTGPLQFFDRPSINPAGTVAFWANYDAGGDAIFLGTGAGSFAPAYDSNTSAFANFGDLDINDSGTIVFQANLDAGGQGVFVGSGGTTTVVADTSGSVFAAFQEVAINNAGSVAFMGFGPFGGGWGIYTGPDPLTDKVIATGDPLFGSTVTNVFLYGGINEVGQVAFRYTLFDGSQGIAVATIPEPSGVLAAAPGLAASLIFYRYPRIRTRVGAP